MPKKKPLKSAAAAPAPLVAIMTGSPSDLPVVVQARDVLDELGVPSDTRVLSAHRTPHEAVAYVQAAEEAGLTLVLVNGRPSHYVRREAMAASTAQGYDGMAAYATHKRAQVALTGLWNQRWNGSPRVYVMHPGWVDTAGVRSSLPWFRATLKHFLRDAEQGADTALWLAEARPEIDGGIYLDRSLQPEHCFAFTRRGECSAEDLHQYLEAQAARCLS